jgi:hypothetical protein
MRYWFAILFIVAVSSANATVREPTKNELGLILAKLQEEMLDPESTRLTKVKVNTNYAVGTDAKATYVCGMVNAKNKFGGYVGASPFFGIIPANGKKFILMLNEKDPESGMFTYLLDTCEKAGISPIR